MIISHSRRFIVFSFPKTGSETIRSILGRYGEEPVRPWRARSRLYPFYPHMPPREAATVFGDRGWDFDGYRRITLVRNPFPRLVSLYRMIAAVDGLWALRRRAGLPVPEFGAWLAATRTDGRGGGGRAHQRWRRFGAWSARNWMLDAAGRPLVSHVLRLETLKDDLPGLLEELDLAQLGELPVLNARSPVDWRAWYDHDSARRVATAYSWDLATFYKSFAFTPAATAAA